MRRNVCAMRCAVQRLQVVAGWRYVDSNDKSIWLFRRQHAVRIRAQFITHHRWFTRTVMTLVLLNMVLLAIDDPGCTDTCAQKPVLDKVTPSPAWRVHAHACMHAQLLPDPFHWPGITIRGVRVAAVGPGRAFGAPRVRVCVVARPCMGGMLARHACWTRRVLACVVTSTALPRGTLASMCQGACSPECMRCSCMGFQGPLVAHASGAGALQPMSLAVVSTCLCCVAHAHTGGPRCPLHLCPSARSPPPPLPALPSPSPVDPPPRPCPRW